MSPGRIRPVRPHAYIDLSLPERCYSDLLRDWTGYDATDGAYRETADTATRILGLDLSVQTLETNVAEDAHDVPACYAQPPAARRPQAAGSILVVQAAGKGVPLVQPARPQPVGKELRATLDGKAAAMQVLQQRARQREGAQIQARVALTDGAERLPQHMTTIFPDFTLILDIIHASAYLWETATALERFG